MAKDLRIGIIGFDTSHVPAFTRVLNDESDPFHVPGGRVVAGYPSFSPDLESSRSRVDGFVKDVTDKYDVEMVDSAEELAKRVDAVLLESVDGRRHLSEVRPVLEAGLPVYIDKPMAASYVEAAKIAELAKETGTPVFSSSSLRFDANVTALKNDSGLGDVLSCDAFSPAALDPTNPGLFWYGIHGVEMLYTFMGTACQTVTAHVSDGYHLAVGTWPEGRIATMRGIREGARGYGVTVYGENKVGQTQYSTEIPIYAQLLKEIVPFFQGKPSPVPIEETLELMAFIQAAIISEEEEREVALEEVVDA